MLIHSARLVSDSTVTKNAWLRWEDGRIVSRGSGEPPDSLTQYGDVLDAGGRWLVPGFIDMHGHGGGGASFNNGDDEIGTALALHRRHGTTRSVLSFSTASLSSLEKQLWSARRYAHGDPLVIGTHLEGPFLSMEHRGSHDPSLLVAPREEMIDRLLTAGDNFISQVTLAPELPGSDSAQRIFLDNGIVVAVGHTNADMATTRAAFDAGATVLTHTFNGMPGIHHRAPGPVMAALRSPGVVMEVINDHVHVHPDAVKLIFDGAPGRVALITDAMAAAGSVDGEYMSGTMRVIVRNGIAELADGSSISGSTLTLDVALRKAVTAGISVQDAVTALTATPARALGIDDQFGRLEAGYAADAILLSDDFTIENVWAAGAPIPLD